MSSQRCLPGYLYSWGGFAHPGGDLSASESQLFSAYLTTTFLLRYYHRSLNIPKLVNVNFTYVPRSMTLARMIRVFKLPSMTHLGDSLREMEEKDVPEVAALYTRYMQRYSMAPTMTEEEVRHQFLSGIGAGEKGKDDSRREGQVVWTYVVEVNIRIIPLMLLQFDGDIAMCSIHGPTRSQISSRSIPCLPRSLTTRSTAS